MWERTRPEIHFLYNDANLLTKHILSYEFASYLHAYLNKCANWHLLNTKDTQLEYGKPDSETHL